jgi:Ca2+-binding RTX toxin-like protein
MNAGGVGADNLEGGAGDDTLTSGYGYGNDVLTGGGGDDFLIGRGELNGGSSTTAVFTGNRADYTTAVCISSGYK